MSISVYVKEKYLMMLRFKPGEYMIDVFFSQ